MKVSKVRELLAHQLRSRVAGDDAAEKAQQIWQTPGPRRFTHTDPIWRVHDDAAMFIGGLRALLVQSLHPLTMAAVAGHSGYRGDPWGRLARTSTFLATTTFGTTEHADQAITQVRSIHDRIRGKTPDGQRYHASDPHLLRWVHIAEIDSFLTSHQRFGPDPLTDDEADQYVAQAAFTAEGLGATGVPTTLAQLRSALADYQPELRATDAALDTMRFLTRTPPIPVLARPGYGLLVAGAISTMPDWARTHLGLSAPHRSVDVLGRTLGAAGVNVVRWALSDPSVATKTPVK